METNMGTTENWRTQLQPDARQRIIGKIKKSIEQHLPIYGPEGFVELDRIATRFEENIYAAATSQSDYLRKISLKMLTLESKSQSTDKVNSFRSNSAASSQNNVPDPVYCVSGMEHVRDLEPIPTTQDIDMNITDWRTDLHPDSRQRIVTKIMETLRRHLPISGAEGLIELNNIAVKFEEKTYDAATSQSDYLRKISVKMLTMEPSSQATGTASAQYVSDPGVARW